MRAHSEKFTENLILLNTLRHIETDLFIAMKNPDRYRTSQIALHWLTAAVVLFLLLPMSREGLSHADGEGAVAGPMVLHIWAGVAVLPLVVLRLALRRLHGVPSPEAEEPPLLCGAGRIAHLSMYGCLIVLPLSGICFWHFGRPEGLVVHEVARVLLTALVGLHVTGATMHHVVFRNRVLIRICRPDR